MLLQRFSMAVSFQGSLNVVPELKPILTKDKKISRLVKIFKKRGLNSTPDFDIDNVDHIHIWLILKMFFTAFSKPYENILQLNVSVYCKNNFLFKQYFDDAYFSLKKSIHHRWLANKLFSTKIPCNYQECLVFYPVWVGNSDGLGTLGTYPNFDICQKLDIYAS